MVKGRGNGNQYGDYCIFSVRTLEVGQRENNLYLRSINSGIIGEFASVIQLLFSINNSISISLKFGFYHEPSVL